MPQPAPVSKQQHLLKLMSRRNGATLADLTEATGWQAHSVRGFISRVFRRDMGLDVQLETLANGSRRYRVIR